MNKKIEELLAKSHVNDEVSPAAIDYEKFANLILEDVAKKVFKHLCNEDTVDEYDKFGWDCLPGDMKNMIKEHFKD